jgi:uracil-DNA glycosylase family 4
MVSIELKEILEDLKRYFEFQKTLGLETVVVAKKKGGQEDVKIRDVLGQIEKPVSDKENVIRIQEQLNIFEGSSRKLTLDEIKEELGNCTRCKLHETRRNIVFGEGNPKARLIFIGEGPGEEEDKQGRPFVGRAGQLLDKIINAMGLKRSEVYIANAVKSRPPGNRTPEPDEVAACVPFLFKQIRAIDPEIIVCLGNTATRCLEIPHLRNLSGMICNLS